MYCYEYVKPKIKRENNCGSCIHFINNGITACEIDNTFREDIYGSIIVGKCELPNHEYDKENSLDGVYHMRWSTHRVCEDYKHV